MTACRAIKALTLASLVLLAFRGFGADDPPNEGRVRLYIRAADPEGGELFFDWKQVEGPPVTIADSHARTFDKASNKWVSETYFVPKVPGKYEFEVTVRNEKNNKSSKRFVQEILPAPLYPDPNPGKPQSVTVDQKVVVSGVDSKAYDNRVITQYEWSIKSAPPDFALSPEQLRSRQFEFIPKKPGKYVFELKVFDGKLWGGPASVEVVVASPKPIEIDPVENPDPKTLPPAKKIDVTATTPQIKPVAVVQNADKQPFRVGDKIVLDGSASSAGPDDDFFWKQLDLDRSTVIRPITPDVNKPFSPTRNDPGNYPVQSFIATDNGSYKFVLQIKSKETGAVVESDPVSIQVGVAGGGDTSVTPKGPIAVLEPLKATISLGDEVKLDASKSHSDDGTPLTYFWSKLPGREFPVIRGGNDGPIVRVYAEKEGEYAVSVVVVDKKGQRAQSEPAIITVGAGDKPPLIEGVEKSYTCNVGEPIGLKARVTDPQNHPVTLKWICLESPPPGKLLVIPPEYAKLPEFRFAPPYKGTYIFRLEATNSKGLTSAIETQIGVKDAAQLKPTAVISAPGQERVNVGDKVTLSAAQSYSPNRKPLSYTWRDESEGGPKIKESVPSRNAKEWTFVASAPGRIVVTLVVNDTVADSEPTKFAVDVMQPVVAKAKPVPKIEGPHSVTAKSEVELSAEHSTSCDNTPLQFTWTQSPPPEGGPDLGLTYAQRHAARLRFIPTQPATYVLTLTVTDQYEQSASERFALEVKAAAAPPSAAASVLTPPPLLAGKEVRLSAKESVSPANLPLSYKWEQTKGLQLVLARDNTQEIVVTPSKRGDYEFKLTVSDGEQQSAPALVSFNVEAGALPTAQIEGIPPPTAGDTVTLDGSASKAPGGATKEFLKYKWAQVKGPPVRLNVGDEAKSKLSFVVTEDGTYTFELRVSEDGVEWGEPASIVIPVKARAKPAQPLVVVENTSVTTEVGVPAAIDASKSTDPDGLPLQFKWSKNGREFAERGPILKFTWEDVDKMVFEVRAFNGKVESEPVQVKVNVVPQGTLPKAKPQISVNGAPVSATNPAKIAFRGVDDKKKIIVLDGSDSVMHGGIPPAKDSDLHYLWKQVGGEDLKLNPKSMQNKMVGLRIYKPGEYKFELIVTEDAPDALLSAPVTVGVTVIPDQPPPPEGPPTAPKE